MPSAVIILTVFNTVMGFGVLFLFILGILRNLTPQGLPPIYYLIVPYGIVLFGGYLLAAAGLGLRQKWGYYAHLVMCVLTIVNVSLCCCFGFIYTILGIIVAMQPQVRDYFGFPPKEPAAVPETAGEKRRDIEFPD